MLLSQLQRDTMPSLARTRALANNLAHITGDPVAVLRQGNLFWTACPADLAVFWKAEIERGDVAIVETVGRLCPTCGNEGDCPDCGTLIDPPAGPDSDPVPPWPCSALKH